MKTNFNFLFTTIKHDCKWYASFYALALWFDHSEKQFKRELKVQMTPKL